MLLSGFVIIDKRRTQNTYTHTFARNHKKSRRKKCFVQIVSTKKKRKKSWLQISKIAITTTLTQINHWNIAQHFPRIKKTYAKARNEFSVARILCRVETLVSSCPNQEKKMKLCVYDEYGKSAINSQFYWMTRKFVMKKS